MPQQLLDTVEFSTVVEQGAGKGVAQDVRAQLARATGPNQAVMHDVIDKRRIQWPPLGGHQQVVALGPDSLAQSAVPPYPLHQLIAKGDNTVLVALAMHLEFPLDGIDSGILQASSRLTVSTAASCRPMSSLNRIPVS